MNTPKEISDKRKAAIKKIEALLKEHAAGGTRLLQDVLYSLDQDVFATFAYDPDEGVFIGRADGDVLLFWKPGYVRFVSPYRAAIWEAYPIDPKVDCTYYRVAYATARSAGLVQGASVDAGAMAKTIEEQKAELRVQSLNLNIARADIFRLASE